MIGIIGRKLGMTQIFNEEGQQIPCTVVEATPNSVVKVLKKDQVGFDSVELGFGEQRHARESKKGVHRAAVARTRPSSATRRRLVLPSRQRFFAAFVSTTRSSRRTGKRFRPTLLVTR